MVAPRKYTEKDVAKWTKARNELGMSYKAISREYRVSLTTVRYHLVEGEKQRMKATTAKYVRENSEKVYAQQLEYQKKKKMV